MARCQIGPKDCFVIFLVLFDVFVHFEETYGDINVSIDGLTFDPMKDKETLALEIIHQTKLVNSFGFYGVRSVSNIICPELIHSCQGDV
jgi:hypothetical protein